MMMQVHFVVALVALEKANAGSKSLLGEETSNTHQILVDNNDTRRSSVLLYGFSPAHWHPVYSLTRYLLETPFAATALIALRFA